MEEADSSAAWNDTAPTTTVVTLNNDDSVQRLNDDFIMYSWGDVPEALKNLGPTNVTVMDPVVVVKTVPM